MSQKDTNSDDAQHQISVENTVTEVQAYALDKYGSLQYIKTLSYGPHEEEDVFECECGAEFEEKEDAEEHLHSALSTGRELVTDGGEVVEHEGLEAVAAEEYDGDEECEYGCGNEAEHRVEMRLGGAADTSLMCNACSQQNKIWVEENELLRGDISERARE